MSRRQKTPSIRTRLKQLFCLIVVVVFSVGWYHQVKPLPSGLSVNAAPQPATNVQFFSDLTFLNLHGQSTSEQSIFDEVLRMIGNANRLIVLDQFLFNDYLGSSAEPYRKLSSELTQALVSQKERFPQMRIIFITDPVNQVYGGLPQPLIQTLKQAGIEVTVTNLKKLRDSNPLYSAWYRVFFAPFGSGPGNALPNPLGRGKVSIRSYLELLNFKANHRKILITDDGKGYRALISSANPHDASSAHDNVALGFSGPAVWDTLQAELAVLGFSNGPKVPFSGSLSATKSPLRIRMVTEKAILHAVVAQINTLKNGEHLDLMMFYISHHQITKAIKAAHQRGAKIRVILDPNKDAFGREKNGIPNRQIAMKLHQAGVEVRWADTHGEQCHSKMLLFRQKHRTTLILGSANLTRRNLDNYNLEANIVLYGPKNETPFTQASRYFDRAWTNKNGESITTSYQTYADHSTMNLWLYEVMERFGLSTF